MKEQKRFADRLQARDEHVMTPDVGQFMQKHSFHLGGRKPAQKAYGNQQNGAPPSHHRGHAHTTGFTQGHGPIESNLTGEGCQAIPPVCRGRRARSPQSPRLVHPYYDPSGADQHASHPPEYNPRHDRPQLTCNPARADGRRGRVRFRLPQPRGDATNRRCEVAAVQKQMGRLHRAEPAVLHQLANAGSRRAVKRRLRLIEYIRTAYAEANRTAALEDVEQRVERRLHQHGLDLPDARTRTHDRRPSSSSEP